MLLGPGKEGGRQEPTIERRVHSTDVDQDADHGHALGSFAIAQELVAKNLARFTAPRHGVDVEVGKVLLSNFLGLVRRLNYEI